MVVGVLSLAACGGSDSATKVGTTPTAAIDTAVSVDTTTAGHTAPNPPISSSLADLLRMIPDTAAARSGPIYYMNFGASPAAVGSTIELLGGLVNFNDGWIGAPFLKMRDPAFAAAAGFDAGDVDATLLTGEVPTLTAVMHGTFEADRLQQGIDAADDEDVTSATDGPYTLLSIGTSGKSNLRHATLLRPNGDDLRLAVGAGVLVDTQNDSDRDAALAADVEGQSLAPDEAYGTIAADLDAAHVYAAVVTVPHNGERWQLVGIGESYHEDRVTTTLVFHFNDSDTAIAAATKFPMHLDDTSKITGQPWSTHFSIQDFRTIGADMIVTLDGTESSGAIASLWQSDTLLDV